VVRLGAGDQRVDERVPLRGMRLNGDQGTSVARMARIRPLGRRSCTFRMRPEPGFRRRQRVQGPVGAQRGDVAAARRDEHRSPTRHPSGGPPGRDRGRRAAGDGARSRAVEVPKYSQRPSGENPARSRRRSLRPGAGPGRRAAGCRPASWPPRPRRTRWPSRRGTPRAPGTGWRSSAGRRQHHVERVTATGAPRPPRIPPRTAASASSATAPAARSARVRGLRYTAAAGRAMVRGTRDSSASASANCAAVANRSAGSLDSAVSTAASTCGGIVLRWSVRRRGSSVITRATTACAVGP